MLLLLMPAMQLSGNKSRKASSWRDQATSCTVLQGHDEGLVLQLTNSRTGLSLLSTAQLTPQRPQLQLLDQLLLRRLPSKLWSHWMHGRQHRQHIHDRHRVWQRHNRHRRQHRHSWYRSSLACRQRSLMWTQSLRQAMTACARWPPRLDAPWPSLPCSPARPKDVAPTTVPRQVCTTRMRFAVCSMPWDGGSDSRLSAPAASAHLCGSLSKGIEHLRDPFKQAWDLSQAVSLCHCL